jgi:hypothetical protein
MKFYGIGIALTCAIGCAVFGQDAPADSAQRSTAERPAMELGGTVTLDYWTATDDPKNPSLSLALVELGANVYLGRDLTATVMIKAEEKLDSIWIDQAVAAWEPASMPFKFYAGMHTLNHGLYTTRMINYVSIQDVVKLVKPAVTVLYSPGIVTLGAAATMLEPDGLHNLSEHNRYAGVINCDLALPHESLLRLSSLASRDMVDVDLAAEVAAGPFTIDAEAVGRWARTAHGAEGSGYYIGLAYAPADWLEIALRNDGTSDKIFREMDYSFAAGLTFPIVGDVYGAIEYDYGTLEDELFHHQICLEIGLESNLKIPGFQPKSLVRPE